MFKKARLKLTVWYLLIIMTISVSFSAVIYQSVVFELQRRLDTIQRRVELYERGFPAPPPSGPFSQTQLFLEDFEDSRRRVLLMLVYTNVGILLISAAASYFMAGKTLKPIEAAMEEQKRFISDASHELKTPLTSLMTSIEVALRDKQLNLKDAKEVLKDNLFDIVNLKDLSNNLLSLTRYQQDHNYFKIEKVNTKEAIEAAEKVVAPIAKSKKITLNINNKKYFVRSSKDGVEKLVTILLDNAVKYTPEKGKVELFCTKENKSVVIRVKDSGIGIPKKDIPHVFDRFYRVDESRTKGDVSGFGLGLSIAKQIVDLSRGSISVKSKKDKGSTFIVKLPYVHT